MPTGGSRKSVKPPALQPAVAQTSQISEQAAAAGGAERRRIRRNRGTAGNILTRPGDLGVATTQRPTLKSFFGGS